MSNLTAQQIYEQTRGSRRKVVGTYFEKSHRVEIKDEGYNDEGQLIGPVYVDNEVYNNGDWLTLKEAQQMAKLLKCEVSIV